MKKTGIILALVFAFGISFGQDQYESDEINTVFSKRRSNGGYGAFSIGYTQIDGKDALISGGRGAFIFDHSLAIGLGGYGFVNNLDYHDHHEYTLSLAGGYGGLLVEPIVAGRSPVHVSFPILIGMGGISLIETYGHGWDYWDSHHSVHSFGNDVFFVIEPAVELEFNMTRFFRLAAAVSYRHTSSIELHETPGDVLRGFNYAMTFKFGKF